MTTMPTTGRRPEFTKNWRLRLSLETANMSVQEMADSLGYSRSTISRWLNGADEPRPGVLAQWCLLTGVDREWIETGDAGDPTPPAPRRPIPTPGPTRGVTRRRGRGSGAQHTDEYVPDIAA